jgi:hypothetical protein
MSDPILAFVPLKFFGLLYSIGRVGARAGAGAASKFSPEAGAASFLMRLRNIDTNDCVGLSRN